MNPCSGLGYLITGLAKLPEEINIKLRDNNRRDVSLPDSHGQIWMELVCLSEMNPSLFEGSTNSVQRQMLQSLGLGGGVKFPIRRLVTLWRNSNWKRMTTEWCRTSVGRETFNVSAWDEMARCRVDEVPNTPQASGGARCSYKSWLANSLVA